MDLVKRERESDWVKSRMSEHVRDVKSKEFALKG